MTATSSSAAAQRPGGDVPLDVHSQAARLREFFEPPKEATLTRFTKAAKAVLQSPRSMRAAKIAAGLALLTLCGIAPARRLLEDSSIDAITNAPLITIRAPIDGVVEQAQFNSPLGKQVAANDVLLQIKNPIPSRGRLDDVSRDLRTATARRDGLRARLASLHMLRAQLTKQLDEFRAARRIQVRANINDIKAQLSSSESTRKQLERDLLRAQTLARAGAQSEVALERTIRDTAIATATTASLQQRLTSVKAEADALDKGFFVGDAYNDRPSSGQQADDVAVRIAESKAELAAAEASVTSLQRELTEEQRLQQRQTEMTVVSPAKGPIWDVLVSAGEQVTRGQDLLRILDCSTGLVSASVRDSIYERLRVGEQAKFVAAGTDKAYAGMIVRLASASSRRTNLAAQLPGNGPYQVTVAVPGLNAQGCLVGSPGRLVFNSGDSAR